MPSILILGATGYLGGAVLTRLASQIQNQSQTQYEITGLVRNPTHNQAILDAGAHHVVNPPPTSTTSITSAFSADPEAFLESLAFKADIIINCSSIRELGPVRALLRGMKRRFDAQDGDGEDAENGGEKDNDAYKRNTQKKKGVFITIMGTGSYRDERVDGRYDEDGRVYSDMSEDDKDIKDIPPVMKIGSMQVERLDLLLLEAASASASPPYILNYTILAGAILGRSPGPVSKLGLMEPLMNTVKTLGYPFYIGEGTCVVGAVHVVDLADLFVLVLQKSISDQVEAQLEQHQPGPLTSHTNTDNPYNRYYFASVADFSTRERVGAIGEVLYRHGILGSKEPKEVSIREAGFFGPLFAANVMVKSERAMKELGWKPTRVTLETWMETAEEYVTVKGMV